MHMTSESTVKAANALNRTGLVIDQEIKKQGCRCPAPLLDSCSTLSP